MKKNIILILFIVTLIALSGCGSSNNTSSSTTGNSAGTAGTINTTSTVSTTNSTQTTIYKDGVYDIKHKSTKEGFEEAIVTIKAGKIEAIELKRLDASQKEVNYNDWDGTKNFPNLKQFRLDLAKTMLDKQSPEVDTISSATQSSNGWKIAVADALAKAK